ncbi:MAG: beta-1,6-N-acetylglucosaminyltransferase [Proteobacteria bacterium]|nr:beta-1,6-N-acetylglucosaminyltransferase [Pseudomonadota bacterium]
MAKIAFILLCHKDPEGIIAQAGRLTAAGDCIAIHFDARARQADYAKIRAALADNPGVTFARRRVKCGWGEWSLVAATLRAVEAAVAAFPTATHFYMLSGDCMPVKTAEHVHDFLDAEDADYIESFDFFRSDWIKTGMREDRLIYRHFFNERQQKRLFYAAYELQKRFGFRRDTPADLRIMIGSQWWCLRRRTVEWILDLIAKRRDILRFFRTTWIPDETFFQTLVRHVVPDKEIRCRTLTFLMFTDYGMPVTFYNDHYDLLIGQDALFARKISAEAAELKARLGDLYAAKGVRFRVSDEGRKLFHFLTGRGRIGRRFARRFWETESTLGRGRELLVVICKKWHVAKRLVARMSADTGIPAMEYLFDEATSPVPDLGGVQSSLAKRNRHRRALLRMLYDRQGSDRLIICLDPAGAEVLKDLAADRATVRMLEVECTFSDDYLAGHARRVGLAGDHTQEETMVRLLPTIRHAFRHESDVIRDASFSHLYLLRECAGAAENAVPLSAFLGIAEETARGIAAMDHLFSD